MTETCTCSRLKVGHELTETRNWNPDCAEHGAGIEWYRSEEQVRARQDLSLKSVGMQLLAREMRRYPPPIDVSGEMLKGFADLQSETGFAVYWYLWAAGSTYLLGDVY